MVYDAFESTSVIYGTIDTIFAYVRFTDFNALTYGQFNRAMDELMQNELIRAFVFDVRGLNTGSDLSVPASILDRLMGQGTIISGIYSGEISKVLYTSDAEQLQ